MVKTNTLVKVAILKPVSVFGIVTRQWDRRSGVQIPAETRQFSLFINVLLVGTGVLSWGSRGRGVMLTTHHHPVPKLRMSGVIHLLPLYVFMARTRTTSPFIKLNSTLTVIFFRVTKSVQIMFNFKHLKIGPQVHEAAWPPCSHSVPKNRKGRTLSQFVTYGVWTNVRLNNDWHHLHCKSYRWALRKHCVHAD
jgi:hypothetical protein